MATIVYEDDKIMAILPKEQISKGHTLLIPKEHFADIFEIPEDLFKNFTRILKSFSKALVAENQATGLNILNANGRDAQQSVPHLHFHLVPRYPNDGLDLWLKAGFRVGH
jgi:histidine triad (HIT) family protein